MECSTGIFLKASYRSYPIPSTDQKESDKLLNWSMHDPWVLRFKVGSPWTSVKWIDLEKRVVSESIQDSEDTEALFQQRLCQKRSLCGKLATKSSAEMLGTLCRKILGRGSSEMTSPSERIVVYGASWCPDARRARRFFDEQGVEYTWIDIDEDSEASNFVRETNGGQIVIPVIVFPDQSILVEPSNYELAKKMEALLGEPDPQS